MRIAIVGAGAMGGLYGAFLAHAGYDVHFLMRRDYEAVKSSGLIVKSFQGDFHLDKVNCYRRVEDIGRVDLVFIGLKTTANTYYRELITPLMGSNTRVLTAQNGLGNENQLAELFGPLRVSGGLAYLGSNRAEPGVIHHLTRGNIHIGNFQRPPDDALRKFAQMMQNSNVECHIVDDLALERWKKLIWNVPFNGLSALLDLTVDKIIQDPKLYQRAWRLMKEIQAAAQTEKSNIEDSFLEQWMNRTIKLSTHLPYYTSMHLDRLHQEPMEIEPIIGEPLRRGLQHGLQLPEMQILYTELKEIDQSFQKDL